MRSAVGWKRSSFHGIASTGCPRRRARCVCNDFGRGRAGTEASKGGALGGAAVCPVSARVPTMFVIGPTGRLWTLALCDVSRRSPALLKEYRFGGEDQFQCI